MGFIRALRLFLGVLAAVLSLGILYVGAVLLWDWFRVRSGQYFYVGDEVFDYLGKSLQFVIIGSIGLWASLSTLIRREAKVLQLTLACVMGFAGTVMTLAFYVYGIPLQTANIGVTHMVGDVHDALFKWVEKNGHFPTNEWEFRSAVGRLDLTSPFKRSSGTVSYRLIFVDKADGPTLSSPPPQEPGVIVCAVSADARQVWITATALERWVGGRVVWLPLLAKPHVKHTHLSADWYRPPE